jgi:hypothetical protein
MKAFVADVLGPKVPEGPRSFVRWAVLEETGEGAIEAFVRAVPRGSEIAVLGDTLEVDDVKRNGMRPGVAVAIS